MKKIVIFFMILSLLLAAGCWGKPAGRSSKNRKTQPSQKPLIIGKKITKQVKVYYVHIEREEKAFKENDPESPAAYRFAFPLKRTIKTTTTTAVQDAIKELLKEPTAKEKKQGYSTEIHNIELGSLVIKNETATAKFSGSKFYLSGDMSGARVRAQIEKTLLQFPEIKKVVIYINGNPKFDSLEG